MTIFYVPLERSKNENLVFHVAGGDTPRRSAVARAITSTVFNTEII
jgi:hypothetical protein